MTSNGFCEVFEGMIQCYHMKHVAIYTTPTCVWCHRAKEFFKEKGVAYEEYNVATDAARREEMIKRSGQLGVPVIDIEGDLTVGFDEERIKGLLGL